MTTFGIAKPRRLVDPKFLSFVREKKCLGCGRFGVDAHHLDTRGSGGSDYSAVPLCRCCHTEWHQSGPAMFEQRHRVNLWRECAGILSEYFTTVEPVAFLAGAGVER